MKNNNMGFSRNDATQLPLVSICSITYNHEPYIRQGLFDDKKNFSLYHEAPLKFVGGDICVVQDEDRVEIFDDACVECFHTLGHDTSCMTFRCGDYLFTGDSYIPNEKPVTNLKGGNKDDYYKSLEIINGLIKQGTILCPGHGEIV